MSVDKFDGGDGDESFTAEEKAYFDNGGEVADQEIPLSDDDDESGEETASQPEESGDQDGDDADDRDSDGEPDRSKDGRFVRHEALREERERRKETQRELRELRERSATMEGRMQALLDAMQGKRQPQEPQEPVSAPDPDEDVFGATRHAIREAETLRERLDQMEGRNRDRDERATVERVVSDRIGRYMQERPDYLKAVEYLRNIRATELAEDYGVPEHKVREIIENEEMEFARNNLKAGRDPVDLFYKNAMRRGYRAKANESLDIEDTDAGQKLDRIEKGQRQHKSMSGLGGRATGGDATPDAIANMSEDDFGKWLSGNRDKFRKMMGG